MEGEKKTLLEEKKDIELMMAKLANSNDIQSYKNKIMKSIEENNKRIFGTNKKDKKSYLLLTRTYYLKEFEKIDKIIQNEELINENNVLTDELYLQLLSYLNLLLSFEDLYINDDDNYRSLQLQSKIINIIKKFVLKKIGKD
jgi:hypothetical protein